MKKLLVLAFLVLASSGSWASAEIPRIARKVTLQVNPKKTIEQAIFEATFVINQETLKALAHEAKPQIRDLNKKSGKVEVDLHIPSNYLVRSMTMYEEIDLATNTSVLSQLYHGKRIKLLAVRVATGQPGMGTPEGNFCIKRVTHLPNYYPPKEWGGNTNPVRPGPKNPYGLWMSEILRFSTEPAGYEFAPKGILTRNGVNQHSTNRPRSIGRYASHACVRMHPEIADRLFPFFLRYISHRPSKNVYRGREVWPFCKGSLIYVKIYRSKIAKPTKTKQHRHIHSARH